MDASREDVQNRRCQIGHPLTVTQIEIVHDVSAENAFECFERLSMLMTKEMLGAIGATHVLIDFGLAIPPFGETPFLK